MSACSHGSPSHAGENTTPVTPREIVSVLVGQIDTLTTSFADSEGMISEPEIVHEIACLRAAIIIIHGFARLRLSAKSTPSTSSTNP